MQPERSLRFDFHTLTFFIYLDYSVIFFSQQVERLTAWKEENEVNKKVKEQNEEKIKKDEIKLAK
jgi:hypothetical protein